LLSGSAVVGLPDPLNHGGGGRGRKRQDEFVSAAVAVGLSGIVLSAAVWAFMETRLGALGAVGTASHQEQWDKHKELQKNQHFNEAGDAHGFSILEQKQRALALTRRHSRNGRFGPKKKAPNGVMHAFSTGAI